MSKKQTTEIAVVETNSVTEMIQAIQAKIAKQKKIQETPYVTSGIIQGSGGSFNIKEEKDNYKLVVALSSVIARSKAVEAAYEALGVTEYLTPKVDGFVVEDWTKDVQLRMSINDQKETTDELQSIQKEYEDLMDKEDKKALLYKRMQKFAE